MLQTTRTVLLSVPSGLQSPTARALTVYGAPSPTQARLPAGRLNETAFAAPGCTMPRSVSAPSPSLTKMRSATLPQLVALPVIVTASPSQRFACGSSASETHGLVRHCTVTSFESVPSGGQSLAARPLTVNVCEPFVQSRFPAGRLNEAAFAAPGWTTPRSVSLPLPSLTKRCVATEPQFSALPVTLTGVSGHCAGSASSVSLMHEPVRQLIETDLSSVASGGQSPTRRVWTL